MYIGNKWVWLKYLSFYEFALNSIVAASTSKVPFELVYGGNVIVPLDLTGAAQLSHMQAAGEIAEEISWLVDMAKTELETA